MSTTNEELCPNTFGKTAEYWIEKLQLEQHPAEESGFFRETYRDAFQVKGLKGQDRAASTLIYFLHKPNGPLQAETTFFRVQSSEMIHYYCGEPLELYLFPNDNSAKLEKIVLGPDPEKGHQFHYVFPQDRWFSRVLDSNKEGAYTLIGATVAPGFDFNDLKTATYEAVVESLTKAATDN